MKRIIQFFLYICLRFALWTRYSIKVKGRDQIPKKGGILFLANHPAEIDPPILLRTFWPQTHLRPVALEALFHKKWIRWLLNLVGAFSVPNFEDSSNSYKQKQIEKTYQEVFKMLERGESLLLYPAGCLKRQAEEVIGGASGVHRILQACPDVQVVLIRTTGLWGSSFSRAPTNSSPDISKTVWHGLKNVMKNGIFFSPRRKVTIECELASTEFPRRGERRELNRYLEEWYNQEGPEPLVQVSSLFWKNQVPDIVGRPEEEKEALVPIPEEVEKRVKQEIGELVDKAPETIERQQHLALDLGLDSLDVAQLVVFLKEEYRVQRIASTELETVGHVMAFAAHLKEGALQEEEEDENPFNPWEKEEGRPPPAPPKGKTLPEAFLRASGRMANFAACVDLVSGPISYKRFKFAVFFLARLIKKLPGDRIGIMLPASSSVNIVMMATLFAKKTPVMINWTLGPRNLASVVEQSKIEVTLSSWAFLDRLDNVDLDGIDGQILLLEELVGNAGLRTKLSTWIDSRRGTLSLFKRWNLFKISPDEPAVILFTSGTESLPKGVPLSHKNLLANQRGAFRYVSIREKDVLLGVLPPFHSFGFSVTGLLPLLTGMPVAFSPNPTDGRRMARAIDRWGVTLLCLAPTFLRTLLRVARKEQLRSLRLIVAGAEKLSADIEERAGEVAPQATLIEGYGITECSPILTLNPPDQPTQGVGLPLPKVELMIVHPETEVPVEKGKAGLILARGPNVFEGYLDHSLASPFVEIGGKRWYRTGDLGSVDERGYLSLSGRLKRFIKIGGEMVSLTAIEEVLREASQRLGWHEDEGLPFLAVCAHEEGGKKGEIHLFVTFPVGLDQVNTELRNRGMSNLIKVARVNQLPALPLLGSGKIDYRSLCS